MPKKNNFRYFIKGPSKSEELKQEIINDYLKENWKFVKYKKNYAIIAPSGGNYPFYVPIDLNLYSAFEDEVFDSNEFNEKIEANFLYRIIKTIPDVNKECLVNKCNEFCRKIKRKKVKS